MGIVPLRPSWVARPTPIHRGRPGPDLSGQEGLRRYHLVSLRDPGPDKSGTGPPMNPDPHPGSPWKGWGERKEDPDSLGVLL